MSGAGSTVMVGVFRYSVIWLASERISEKISGVFGLTLVSEGIYWRRFIRESLMLIAARYV